MTQRSGTRTRASRHRQAGIAIITAVLTAALVAALVAWMAWRQQLWFRQIENQFDQAQARGVARAAIQMARLTMRDDARHNQVDNLLEPWNIPIPSIPVEKGRVGGRVLEQQGRFNLNNIAPIGTVDPVAVAAAERLFKSVGVPVELVNALADWEDGDSETRYPGGAEDLEYLNQTPPYRAANRPLADIESLARVQGFTRELIAKLAPHVAVLPQASPVNVNFASAEVLAAVIPDLTLAEAQAVVSKRAGKYFETLQDFSDALPERVRANVVAGSLSIQSRYFINEVDAQFGRVTVRYAALLERNGNDAPRIVWLKRR
ncbi:putative type II secretion system protein K [Andreprevotia sp. IGB-42]|uniref:type II secretion system minor pseudopilin GspK n=1 Tax=Andreprevotia sp. IGB-42 TaxID=2497473 RepID=UPI00135B88F1|nr:type II secretion system minor pseudopilin GspK [Andreprevotia sp. IGB-42]KAF0814298.1 putative type II secretion system protein K [Andreprevotia sp. IGB-42]